MALLRREDIGTLTYPQWLMDGILPAEAVSMVYGRSGTGKSFWVLDMAACVATGRKWAGLVVRQGPVVYVAGEGKSGYKARLEAWEKQHRAYAADFLLRDVPVRLWGRNSSRGAVQQFVDEVNGAGVRPVLVVLDTLGTCLGGADENDNGQMRELLDGAEDIRREWEAAVLLVHHTGKSESSRVPRGAQALADGVAMHAYFTGDGKTYGVLDCTKQKDAKEFGPIRRTLHPVRLGPHETSLAFADAHRTGPRDRNRRRVSWEDARQFMVNEGSPVTPALVAAALNISRQAAHQHLSRAVENGYAESDGTGGYVLVPDVAPDVARAA